MLVVAALLPACRAPSPPTVVYMTDFGTADGAVCAMKGVARDVEPALVFEDLTHEIPPYDIWQAAFRLHQTAPFWPAGTVFVTVIDPGVGTDRKPVAARDSDGRVFVCPDNGILTLLLDSGAIRDARVLSAAGLRRAGSAESHTFEGRDLFSRTGALLASGQMAFDALGEAIAPGRLVRLEYPKPELVDVAGAIELRGFVVVLDGPFGNVWTNIPPALIARAGLRPGTSLDITIAENGTPRFHGPVVFARTFGDVPERAPLAYSNSLGDLAFATNLGNFAREHGLSCGPQWTVTVRVARSPRSS